MPVAIDDVQEVRRAYQKLVKASAVAEGRRQAAMDRLRGEFGVQSVEAAKRLLSKLRRRAKARAEAYFAAKAALKQLLVDNGAAIDRVVALSNGKTDDAD